VGLACLVGDDAAEDGSEGAGSVLVGAAGWRGLVLGSLGGSSVASGASLLASTCGGIRSAQQNRPIAQSHAEVVQQLVTQAKHEAQVAAVCISD